MDTSSEETLISRFKQESDTIQKARIIYALYRDRSITLREIASKLHMDASYPSHYLRILELPSIILDGYYNKQISSAHLFILSRLASEEVILKAYKIVLEKSLTSAQTEELVRSIKFQVSSGHDQLTKKEIDQMIQDIQQSFPNVEVKVIQTKVRGKVELEIHGDARVTSGVIKKIASRLKEGSFSTVYDDRLQILE